MVTTCASQVMSSGHELARTEHLPRHPTPQLSSRELASCAIAENRSTTICSANLTEIGDARQVPLNETIYQTAGRGELPVGQDHPTSRNRAAARRPHYVYRSAVGWQIPSLRSGMQ
jgi:hypothetical protein